MTESKRAKRPSTHKRLEAARRGGRPGRRQYKLCLPLTPSERSDDLMSAMTRAAESLRPSEFAVAVTRWVSLMGEMSLNFQERRLLDAIWQRHVDGDLMTHTVSEARTFHADYFGEDFFELCWHATTTGQCWW